VTSGLFRILKKKKKKFTVFLYLTLSKITEGFFHAEIFWRLGATFRGEAVEVLFLDVVFGLEGRLRVPAETLFGEEGEVEDEDEAVARLAVVGFFFFFAILGFLGAAAPVFFLG